MKAGFFFQKDRIIRLQENYEDGAEFLLSPERGLFDVRLVSPLLPNHQLLHFQYYLSGLALKYFCYNSSGGGIINLYKLISFQLSSRIHSISVEGTVSIGQFHQNLVIWHLAGSYNRAQSLDYYRPLSK